MSKIKVLAEQVTNKIAAGEIIERPASIVKELVENSIDAKAAKITVILERGGKKRIEVIDDGVGMDEQDALLALERHATSKIRNVEDIICISSMGFRGEAIPSIASVSKMVITTKTESSKTAVTVEVDSGKIMNVRQSSANRGTSITVTKLFENLPARKKFLKSEPVELRHIINYIHYQALTFPETGFRLIHNGNQRLHYPAVREKMNRYTAVLGSDFLQENLIPLEEQHSRVSISGFISGLEEKSNRVSDFRYLFINNRFIKDRIVMHAVNAAYEPFIKKFRIYNQGKLPPFVLFLNLDPELVDFNVHPAKMEVRFRDAQLVHSFVKNSITEKLLEYQEDKFQISLDDSHIQADDHNRTAVPESNITDTASSENQPEAANNARKSPEPNTLAKKMSPKQGILQDLFQPNIFSESRMKRDPVIPSFEHKGHPSDIHLPEEEELVNPWQLHESYVLLQCEDGLIMIDQHAAHERIIYEKLIHRMSGVPATTQQLLFPVVIDVPPILAEIVEQLLSDNEDLLMKIGFKLSAFSGNSIVINEIPAELSDFEGGEVFKDVLLQLQDEFSQTKDFRDSIAKAVSCKAAIKINKRLGRKEMLKLINDLFACQVPWFCPHGRPILIKMTLQEIERRFKRI